MKKCTLLLLIFAPSVARAMLISSTKPIAPLAQLMARAFSASSITKDQFFLAHDPTEAHFKKLQEEFPDKVLQRYIKDHDHRHLTPTSIRDEWIKYALMARNGESGLGMFSKDVDNLWHTFLLFNKDYEAYCSLLDITKQNKSVLYHIPHAQEAICPRVCQWDKKKQFVETYKNTFRSEPDKAIWMGLLPCRPSCDPASEAERSLLSKIDLFNARPTFIGAAIWYAAIMVTYDGIYDDSLAEFFIGLSLGTGRFLWNRIDDRNSGNSSSRCSGSSGGSNSPGCGSGSSCGGGGGSCGGCD